MKKVGVGVLLVSFLIVIMFIFIKSDKSQQNQVNAENSTELVGHERQKKVRSEMEQIEKEQSKDSNIFSKITNELKAKDYKVLESKGIQYTSENGWELLIEIPARNNTLNSTKKEIKEIANKFLEKSDISELNFSVKIRPVDVKNKKKQ
ncbi:MULTISPECIES: hypothetical protein [Halobacillus]|uniref:hypothetical protein n=1 Tax=Halobacillus TaxID=45667 RepID=UPI0009A75D15|nr:MULTISPECIES: hypothetical protein [Halobacillus]